VDILEYTIESSPGKKSCITGDIEALKEALKFKPYVEDQGIGWYDAGGKQGVDVHLGAEIDHPGVRIRLTEVGSNEDGVDFECLLDDFLDVAGIERSIDWKDEDDIDEEDGVPYVRRRGSGVTATFTLEAVSTVEESSTSARITLCYA